MGKKQDEQLERIRHSAAHVLADAVTRLYPGVKLGIGPATEDGFYYDFDFTSCENTGEGRGKSGFLGPEDLPEISAEMQNIISEDLLFEKQNIDKDEAEGLFRSREEDYKLELLENIPDDDVTLYKHGDFTELCRGPHVKSAGQIGAFKLLSVAGAYWKGDENNRMLQRIYGTAFRTKKELRKFLDLREQARKRDHRKLGKELELFSFNESMGAGLVLYHPKGALLRQLVIDHITREHLARDYQLISSPHILKSDVWIRSGHYEYYREHMYIFESEGQEYGVKPMNCPGHIMVYASRTRSYKDLPLRFFELGTVYRHEKSGVLHGLLRVRGFTQDDAHIFCLHEQVEQEVIEVIDFVAQTLEVFGFRDFKVELSTRPEKYIGTEEAWEQATAALKGALEKKQLEYEINEGDGAFYGPKIDIKLKDALGREWQCATVQCDFALPERFDLTYVDGDGREKRPAVLHRVILGSLERFIGALIEHYGGDFPMWLAPVQGMIIPISEEQVEYGRILLRDMKNAGFRVELDPRDEKMQKKIRDAETSRIPYMFIIGQREKENGTVSVRSRKDGRLGAMEKASLFDMLKEQAQKP